MRPVNLMPSGPAAAAVVPERPSSRGMIGGLALAGAAALLIVGYFAVARVDTIRSEAQSATVKASTYTSQTGTINQKIADIGAPSEDSDKTLARGAESVLVAAYTERHDFVMMARELQGIMQGTDGWYERVETTIADGGYTLELVGYMPTAQLAAGFDDRVEATRTLADAEMTSIESTLMRPDGARRASRFWKFTVTARMVDTIAPFASSSTASDGTGSLVSSGGTLSLSLDPEPKHRSGSPAKPANPFAAAALVAGGGT